MTRTLFLALLLAGFALVPATLSLAQDKVCSTGRDGRVYCPAPDSSCLQDRYGDVVCSQPGGGIEIDRYGEPVCGPGYCTKDLHGELFCSNAPRGAAATDRYGVAACAGECVKAQARQCVKPRPMR
jgi:hypothetical protein